MSSHNTNIVTVKADFNKKYCEQKITLLQLEGYKKTFQSFWVQFVEQFIPATTIFVSGEKWCNREDEICTQYDECDFDYEFVEGEVTTIPNSTTNGGRRIANGKSKSYDPNTVNADINNTTFSPLDYESTKNGPISTDTVKINPLPKEYGKTTIKPLIVTNLDDRKKRKQLYQDRLQPTQTITE